MNVPPFLLEWTTSGDVAAIELLGRIPSCGSGVLTENRQIVIPDCSSTVRVDPIGIGSRIVLKESLF